MKYVLLTIQEMLENEGYQNLFVDYQPEQKEKIVIMNSGGVMAPGQPVIRTDFDVYAGSSNNVTASDTINSLFEFLNNNYGLIDDKNKIINIEVTNTPRFFVYNVNAKSYEYIASFQILHTNSDAS